MQPLTAAVPFKPEGAALLGGGRPAVGTAGDSESALCPGWGLFFFFSPEEALEAAGDQRELDGGGAPGQSAAAGIQPSRLGQKGGRTPPVQALGSVEVTAGTGRRRDHWVCRR